MSHINYNHLYYFQHVYKKSSVVGAAKALYLTPQTITKQIQALKKRLQSKLFKRKKRSLKPSKLKKLVYRYANKMFTLSQKMLNIVNYRKKSNLLFNVSVANALSKRLVSSVLNAAVVKSKPIHLRCFKSTHKMLLKQLSQHKLNIIISNCPINSTQQKSLFSVKISKCSVSFWCTNPPPKKPFPACLKKQQLLIPGQRSMLRRKLLNQFNSQGLNVKILSKFNNAALIKAFGAMHNAIFVAPTLYAYNFYANKTVVKISRVKNVIKKYHAIFAKQIIQHPAVQQICNTNYSALFSPAAR